MLDEKLKAVVEMYPVKMIGSCRGRGAFVCMTDTGPKLLKEYPYSENHLIYENMLKTEIVHRGYEWLDSLCRTKSGELSAEGPGGKKYVMKQWYDGRECDVSDRQQILRTAGNLGSLHRAMAGIYLNCEWLKKYRPLSAEFQFKKRSRELRTMMNYIQAKKIKNDFEMMYLRSYAFFYEQGLRAGVRFEERGCQKTFEQAIENGCFVHGDYSYHHVIFLNKETATVNFDRAAPNVQIYDLYQFMRKILEKHEWDCELGFQILEAYEKERRLDKGEREYLNILLLYPEKFWKIANHYYNSRKSWTSFQNIDKLKRCIQQIEKRNRFIDDFCRII